MKTGVNVEIERIVKTIPENDLKSNGKFESGEDSFDKFQLEEYKNISTAHFEANKQIGIFFRYFLLIASAPAFIIIYFFGGKGNIINIKDLFSGTILDLSLFIGLFLIIISFIGSMFCFYIISFRLDSILYARTVNGIRKYFYSKKNSIDESIFRVLPTKVNQPKYDDLYSFSIVLFALALVNSVYFGIGTKIIAGIGNIFFENYLIIKNYTFLMACGASVIIFLIHYIYYKRACLHMNNIYTPNPIIGIDIDGVLNKHRETFCTFLKKNANKDLKPEEITNIPVSMISGKDITSTDEHKVFNDLNYWIQQLLIGYEVGLILKDLRENFGYKINVFSYRNWPKKDHCDHHEQISIVKKWSKYSFPYINFSIPFDKYKSIYGLSVIKSITRKWLKKNQIKFDKIIIDSNRDNDKLIEYNRFKSLKKDFRNRYYHTKLNSYRFFIDDELPNAIKLSYTCKYVLLIDQPYNQFDHQIIPSNIIRVYSWSEIKEKIKELS